MTGALQHYVDPETGEWTIAEAAPHEHADSLSFFWLFDSVTTMADPGDGTVRSDNASSTLVTNFAISHTTDGQTDVLNLMKSLATGDMIYIQKADDASAWARYRISATPTVYTTWTKIPVTWQEQLGSNITKNQRLLIRFTYGGGGGAVLDARYVRKAGDTMSGALNMGSQRITSLADAAASTDALNRQYADARYVNLSGDTMTSSLTATGLYSDTAAGGKVESRSTTYMLRFWAEEANAISFISSLRRSDSAQQAMEFQASTFKFQYGNTTFVYDVSVGDNRLTVGTGLTNADLRFWCTSYISRMRAYGASGFRFINDAGALLPVHASSFPTTLVAFNSENPVPDAAVPDEPVIDPLAAPEDQPPIEDEVDLAAMVSILYDTVMALPGGKEMLKDKAEKHQKRKKDKAAAKTDAPDDQ